MADPRHPTAPPAPKSNHTVVIPLAGLADDTPVDQVAETLGVDDDELATLDEIRRWAKGEP